MSGKNFRFNSKRQLMTATAAQLHDAVVAALKENGRYDRIKGEIRKEVFQLLTGDDAKRQTNEQERENFLINELIREYLQFNGYNNSLSVFMRETGQPDEPMNREFLAQSLNVVPHRLIPILYSMTCEDDGARVVRVTTDHETVIESDSEAMSDDSAGFFEIKSNQ